MVQVNINGTSGNAAFQRASDLARRSNINFPDRGRFEDAAAGLYARQQQAESRNSAPLRPSTHASALREIQSLDFMAAKFQRRWGVSPFNPGELSKMRSNLGTAAAAQQSAAVLRLGNIAQHAGIKGDLGMLTKLSRELQQIRQLTEKQYKFATSPSDQASLQRIKDSLYVAEERIVGGLSGSRRGRIANAAFQTLMGPGAATAGAGAAGGRYGGLTPAQRMTVHLNRARGGFHAYRAAHASGGVLGGLSTLGELAELGGPAMLGAMFGAAGIAGTAVIEAPMAINSLYASAVSGADSYIRYRRQLARQARGAGFSASAAEAREMKSGARGYYEFSRSQTAEARAFGLSPQDVGRLYSEYGVGNRNGRMGVAEAARMGSLMPGNVLPVDTIARMMGGAVNMGVVGNNQQGWNSYFRQLQKVESESTRRGIDASKMATSWQSFLQSASNGSAGGLDFRGLSSLFTRLEATGPSGRSGQLQQSILAGTQHASDNLGLGGAASLAVGLALGKHPNALMTKGGIQKFLGLNDKEFAALTSTPGGKRALTELLESARAHNGYMEEQYVGVLARNNPEFYRRMINQLPIPKYMKDLVLSRATNISLSKATSWQAMAPASGYHGAGGAFVPEVYSADVAAAKKFGVPIGAMLANTMMESSGGKPGSLVNLSGGGSGAWGAGQIRAGALRDFNRANGTSYTLADMLNPKIGAEVEAWYLGQMHNATGSWQGARLAYHHGLGALQAQGADTWSGEAREFSYLQSQYGSGNSAMDETRLSAAGNTAALKSSEYQYRIVQGGSDAIDGVSATFKSITDEGSKLATVFRHIAQAANGMVLGQTKQNGTWVHVPNAATTIVK